MGAMPLLPALIALQSSGTDLPMGLTAPIPVITTLLLFIFYIVIPAQAGISLKFLCEDSFFGGVLFVKTN